MAFLLRLRFSCIIKIEPSIMNRLFEIVMEYIIEVMWALMTSSL